MPFKKGDPNINRNGRPKKGTCLTEILKEQGNINDVVIKKGKKINRKEALATKLWALAMSGDIAAIKYIYDRIEGKPMIRQEVDMDGGFAVTIIEPPDDN